MIISDCHFDGVVLSVIFFIDSFQNFYNTVLLDSNKTIDDPFCQQDRSENVTSTSLRKRKDTSPITGTLTDDDNLKMSRQSWKRILLLVIAITVHNIPGMWTQ